MLDAQPFLWLEHGRMAVGLWKFKADGRIKLRGRQRCVATCPTCPAKPLHSTVKLGLLKMGRSPCCSKVGLNRGAWTGAEDNMLRKYIEAHGEGNWRSLPKNAGLRRCGKSCRLRWLNYLRPDIKRGNISADEEELIIRMHALVGNRWSIIAGRIPGRTDNEIKNYWNTYLGKKLAVKGIDPKTHKLIMDKHDHTVPNSDTCEQNILTAEIKCGKPLDTKDVRRRSQSDHHHQPILPNVHNLKDYINSKARPADPSGEKDQFKLLVNQDRHQPADADDPLNIEPAATNATEPISLTVDFDSSFDCNSASVQLSSIPIHQSSEFEDNLQTAASATPSVLEGVYKDDQIDQRPELQDILDFFEVVEAENEICCNKNQETHDEYYSLMKEQSGHMDDHQVNWDRSVTQAHEEFASCSGADYCANYYSTMWEPSVLWY
eukprot:Gb_03400 [translate_table: standard]